MSIVLEFLIKMNIINNNFKTFQEKVVLGLSLTSLGSFTCFRKRLNAIFSP